MRIRSITALVLAASVATASAATAPASAAETSTVTSAEVSAALSTTKGQLASPAVNSQVKVPTEPKHGVTLGGITLHLPNASEAGKGVAVASGVTAYSGQNSANAVVTSASGAQFLTVIGNSDAADSIPTQPARALSVQQPTGVRCWCIPTSRQQHSRLLGPTMLLARR